MFVKDIEEIKDYFTGKKQHSDLIDELYRPQTLIKRSLLKGGKTEVILETQQKQLKKREIKAEEKKDVRLKVIDHLLLNEKKLASRHSVLQSKGRSFLKVL